MIRHGTRQTKSRGKSYGLARSSSHLKRLILRYKGNHFPDFDVPRIDRIIIQSYLGINFQRSTRGGSTCQNIQETGLAGTTWTIKYNFPRKQKQGWGISCEICVFILWSKHFQVVVGGCISVFVQSSTYPMMAVISFFGTSPHTLSSSFFSGTVPLPAWKWKGTSHVNDHIHFSRGRRMSQQTQGEYRLV